MVSFENRIRPFIKFYVTFPLSLSILIIIIDVSFRINLLANFVFRVSNFHSQLISLDLIESNFILLCDDETFTTIDFDFFFFIKVSSSSNRSLIRTKKKKNKAKLIQARVRNITDRLPKYLVIDGFLVD